jgi:hypothetical protein
LLVIGAAAAAAGDIDFEEFKQLVYDGMLLEGAIQEYEDAFNAVDDSGNGSIGEGAASNGPQYQQQMRACAVSGPAVAAGQDILHVAAALHTCSMCKADYV